MHNENEDEITALLGKSFETSKINRHSRRIAKKQISEKISQCVICLERIEGYFITPCGHHFCDGCFGDWYESTEGLKKCPVCRQHVSLDEILMSGKAHGFNLKKNSKFVKYTKPIRIVESGSSNTNLLGYGSSSFHSNEFEQITPTTIVLLMFFLTFLAYVLYDRYG